MPASSTRVRFAAVAAALSLVALAVPALAVGGIDVSSWDHPSGRSIHWSDVRAAGKSFVFIKATEGTFYTNPYFASDWRGSGEAHLLRGAYHFADPTAGLLSAVRQAQRFAHVVAGRLAHPSLPPVLDLEVTGGLAAWRVVRWARTWLFTVKTLTGRVPMIYTYLSFWRQELRQSTALRRYPLWIACYCSRPPAGSWPKWTFWQYTAWGRVSGISGPVDLDRFSGTLAQLRLLAGVPTPSPSPSPTPSPSPSPTTSPSISPSVIPTPSITVSP